MGTNQHKANAELREAASEVANHDFESTDYERSNQLAQGIAETHEQINDDYQAGTSDGVLIREDGPVEVPPTAYDDEEGLPV